MSDIIKKRKAFIVHTGISIVLVLFFFGINFFTNGWSEGEWWFIYPTLALALSVGIHYVSSLGAHKAEQMAERWEAREQEKIEELMDDRDEDKLDLDDLERQKQMEELRDRDLV